MDRFVKNFIGASIFYLIVAALLGICMLASQQAVQLRFVHSHLNMLGWVSMMIYGVGYHILPRFMGRKLWSIKLGEIHFYLANIGLVGMLLFYALGQYDPSNGLYRPLTVGFGILEALSIGLFFYNMIVTLFGKDPA